MRLILKSTMSIQTELREEELFTELETVSWGVVFLNET